MKVPGLIILLIIIVLGSYLFITQKKSPFSSPRVTPSSPSPTKGTHSQQPTIDNNDLRAGGSSYRDAQGVYVFLYPADYKLDEQDKQHIRIYKTGATQRGQTEMYDGVIVVFETIDLQGKTLQQWMNDSLKQATADGTSEIVEPSKSITLNNYAGFTYTLSGLGQTTYYVLQKETSSTYAVVITTSVNDPQNVGFQTEVDKTLSTLEILK